MRGGKLDKAEEIVECTPSEMGPAPLPLNPGEERADEPASYGGAAFTFADLAWAGLLRLLDGGAIISMHPSQVPHQRIASIGAIAIRFPAWLRS